MKIVMNGTNLLKYSWALLSFSLISMLVILLMPSCVTPPSGNQILVPAGMLFCVKCGSVTPSGTKDVNCDQTKDFECTGLKDDLGNEVKVWCIDKSFYALLYIPKNGKQRFVGRCPYGGGRNSVRLYVLPDNNNNGKYDDIQGTIWISHDGPAPGEEIPPNSGNYLTLADYFKYCDDDNDKKFDRWSYTYIALSTNKVKQENIECASWNGSNCPVAKTAIKSPKEECFQSTNLLPNPYTSQEESSFISTYMVFPGDVIIREKFVINLAHAVVAIQPEEEMNIREFLNHFVAEMQKNSYLSDLVGIRPEYHFDEEQQQHVVILPCVDPQEIAVMEADTSLQRLAPISNLEAIYDRESGQVKLSWEPENEYETIVVWRNGNRITNYYSGEMNYFIDDFKSSPLDFLRQERVYGTHTYTVFGIRDGVHSIARVVKVNVEPPERR